MAIDLWTDCVIDGDSDLCNMAIDLWADYVIDGDSDLCNMAIDLWTDYVIDGDSGLCSLAVDIWTLIPCSFLFSQMQHDSHLAHQCQSLLQNFCSLPLMCIAGLLIKATV